MKILAVITARGGSQRLPGKNIRPLAGKPLIAWTIQAALESGVFSDVLVSTDSLEIAEVSRKYGGSVPWLRPAELSTSSSTSVDVVVHAVETFNKNETVPADAVMLLQPTSPFRRSATIRQAVEQHVASGQKSVIGVSHAATNPNWCFTLDEHGGLRQLMNGNGLTLNSQSLPTVFAVNGALYLVSVRHLLENRTFYTSPALPEIMLDPVECIDIDTPFDWAVAEAFSQRLAGVGDGMVS